jgi:hypothetical protein
MSGSTPAAFDPVEDLAALAQLQVELDELFALAPERLKATAPAVSAWSSEQHLAHVALANELVLRNLKSISIGKGLLLVRGAEADSRALAVLAEGRIPRGRAQSPRIVRPPERIERALLAQWLADARSALAEFDPHALRPGDPKVPHQLLGPLDGPQWARFAVVHTRHHLAILREVLRETEATARSGRQS